MSPQINPPNQNNEFTRVEPSMVTKVFASALGSGYSPIASGTVGSAVGLVFSFIPGFESPGVIGPLIIIVFLLGIIAARKMERRYGHDPAEVTIDEVVGMWISIFLLPKNILVFVSAFFLFRFFDIIKPFPARKFDTMYGGLGIMMDDVIAGIYTNSILRIALQVSIINSVLIR
jgi:phosphatidylglycerophosphatase A